MGLIRVPERFNPRPFNLLTRVPSGTEPPRMLDSARWHITLAGWDVICPVGPSVQMRRFYNPLLRLELFSCAS
jgi:hypothetical protein